MTDAHVLRVDIRPWSDGDLPLLQRLMGDPAMTTYLGGPESPAKIRERHERYCRGSNKGRVFAIIVGADRQAGGWGGYWGKEWRGQRVWGVWLVVVPGVPRQRDSAPDGVCTRYGRPSPRPAGRCPQETRRPRCRRAGCPPRRTV